MTNLFSKSFLFLLCVTLTSACSAKSDDSAKDVDLPGVSEAQKSTILSKLELARPDLTFTDVRPTADPALFEVEYNDGPVVYVTASGNFFLVGDLFTFSAGRIVNVTEEAKSTQRAKLITELNPEDMISFGPSADEAKAELYVFTDIDCGYCRKLHNEMEELNAFGVRVNYLAYPRAGLGSDVALRMQSAWCSSNPQEALTKLKQGGSIPQSVCDSKAVSEQFLLGQKVGVTGTPALVTSDGALIPGYRPASDLATMLGVK